MSYQIRNYYAENFKFFIICYLYFYKISIFNHTARFATLPSSTQQFEILAYSSYFINYYLKFCMETYAQIWTVCLLKLYLPTEKNLQRLTCGK